MVPDSGRISLARGGADLAIGYGRDTVLGEQPFSRVENERSCLSLSLRRTGLTRPLTLSLASCLTSTVVCPPQTD